MLKDLLYLRPILRETREGNERGYRFFLSFEKGPVMHKVQGHISFPALPSPAHTHAQQHTHFYASKQSFNYFEHLIGCAFKKTVSQLQFSSVEDDYHGLFSVFC
ncbi:hypothetical protein CHARACLAT_011429 [Characodon lateralis]|uniref:Uncharacterized protein n=1 Tax=Characodon lateralis TaxID=208331 RepID=A0ABU7ESU4_9TELE|nr:hypothetical protein [Characodon lateralis]